MLPKGKSITANSGTKVAVLLGINRCGSFPLLFAPHSFFSIWTDLKRSEKIPGAPATRLGEWIWLTGPSGPHQNSPQGLSVPSGFLTRSEIQKFQSPFILCTYSIPGKTAPLVPEFAVEDLPSAELQPRILHLQWRTCPSRGQNTLMMMIYLLKSWIKTSLC